MAEVFDYGERLYNNPGLLPWVVFAVFIVIAIAQHKRIFAYFDARIEAQKAKVKSDAVMAELVRNNTAALQNNTEMLSILKTERHEMAALLENHETLSAERIAHLQTVVNRIDGTVRDNHNDITLIADRTK